MSEAYIVDAIRTPTGKKGGGLSQVHPADLGAHVIAEVLERWEQVLFPIVLIGLGIVILVEGGAFGL